MRPRSIVAAVALLAPVPALAQQVTVQSTGVIYASIQDAIDAAVAGDTLEVAAAIYIESVTVNKDLTIVGEGSDLVTMDGAPLAPVITIGVGVSATISGLTVTSGTARGLSAVASGLLTLDDLRFVDTSTATRGGGALLDSTSGVFTDVAFEGTSSVLDGGALYVTANDVRTLDLTDVTFSLVDAGGNGGALYVDGADVTVTCTDCIVDGASADNGGAFFAEAGGTLTLLGGSVSNSTASADGGALYIDAASLVVYDTSFIGNTTADNGGALALVTPTAAELTGASFAGNSASGNGGAIHGDSAVPVAITNSVFVENTASAGGAAYLTGSGTWTLENDAVLGNAGGAAGAVQFLSTDAAILNTLFADNDATAIAVFAATATIDYSAFYANTSDLAGGSLGTGNLEGLDPRLVAYTKDGDFTNDQLWPSPYSPLIDAGHPDPTYDDPDGSRADIGAYGGPGADPAVHVDSDADGFSQIKDCDDDADTTFPGADELCNLVDDDCDETVDEDALDRVDWYPDADSDGYGDPTLPATACEPPPNHVADATDCDDAASGIHPDADELCDDTDWDCDLDPHLGAIDALSYYPDDDTDGYGDDALVQIACEPPDPSYITVGGDCEDLDPAVNPGQVEVCNGIDDNCLDGEADAPGAATWYLDADLDGHGDAAAAVDDCMQPPDHVATDDDCDDADPDAFPNNTEVCDGADNNCDGETDEGFPVAIWYPDADADGFGADAQEIEAACPPGDGWVSSGGDCDDQQPTVHTGADEICDDLDNDCDGLVDLDDDDVLADEAWDDFDGDGFGGGEPYLACDPTGLATVGGDCDDVDDQIHPDATEVPGNDLDEDCDDTIDPARTGPRAADAPASGCACAVGHAQPAPLGWPALLMVITAYRHRRVRTQADRSLSTRQTRSTL